jgi:hypothetical protein
MTSAISGARLLTLTEHLSSLPVNFGARVAHTLVFCVVFCRLLIFCPFSSGHCILCPSI